MAARQNAPKSQRLNHAARRSSFQDDKATPVLKARDDVPTLCVDDAVASPWPGYLVCHDSTGWPMSCDSCMGRNGDPPASTIAGGDFCDVIVDSNNYNRTACPGDPAPSTLPDGTSVPEDIANGFIQTFCVFVGSDPPLELATWLACFMWGYTHTKDILEEQMFGITGKSAMLLLLYTLSM